ncbi:hypothetical protein S83_004611 [Arachis hypogaea]
MFDHKFENEPSYYSDYSYAESMSGVEDSYSDYPPPYNGRLLECRKKLKKVRSTNNHRSLHTESFPRRGKSQPVSAKTSGISTPIEDSDANEGFESSSPTLIVRQTALKLSSLKLKRSLTRSVSPDTELLRRKFDANSKLHQATCSSALKLAHFCDGHDFPHDQGTKSNKEFSSMKMCSYAYCSAHVWYHDGDSPLCSPRSRRPLKNPNNTKTKSENQRPVSRKASQRVRIAHNEDSVNDTTTDYCETETDLDVDDEHNKYILQQSVRKAFDEMLVPQETEAQVVSEDNNHLNSEWIATSNKVGIAISNKVVEDKSGESNINSSISNEETAKKEETCVKLGDSISTTKEERKSPKGWSNLKKLILFKRFVKALEEAREFNRRRYRDTPLACDAGVKAERVDIERHITEEEKNAEEWMLDYALQKVIAQPPSTPAKRKKRVALLVEAFETVVPLGRQEVVHRRRSSLSNRPRSAK